MLKLLRLKFHLCFLHSKKSGHDHDHHGDVANLPFNSDAPPEFTSKSITTHSTPSSSSLPLDLVSALSFFSSSLRCSNNLIDDDSKVSSPVKTAPEALNSGVEVLAYSSDPYHYRAGPSPMGHDFGPAPAGPGSGQPPTAQPGAQPCLQLGSFLKFYVFAGFGAQLFIGCRNVQYVNNNPNKHDIMKKGEQKRQSQVGVESVDPIIDHLPPNNR